MAARAEGLREHLARETKRADRAEARVRALERDVARLLTGMSCEDVLRSDPHVVIAQVLLPISGVLGMLATLLVYINLFRPAFFGGFDPSPSGLANFLGQLDNTGSVLGLFAFLLGLALVAAPLTAALGVVRRRKWGWTMAVLTWAIWCVPCLPLGAYGLYAFCREEIRTAFLGPVYVAVPVEQQEPARAVRSESARGTRPGTAAS